MKPIINYLLIFKQRRLHMCSALIFILFTCCIVVGCSIININKVEYVDKSDFLSLFTVALF